MGVTEREREAERERKFQILYVSQELVIGVKTYLIIIIITYTNIYRKRNFRDLD